MTVHSESMDGSVICVGCGFDLTENPKIRRNLGTNSKGFSADVRERVLELWKDLLTSGIKSSPTTGYEIYKRHLSPTRFHAPFGLHRRRDRCEMAAAVDFHNLEAMKKKMILRNIYKAEELKIDSNRSRLLQKQ